MTEMARLDDRFVLQMVGNDRVVLVDDVIGRARIAVYASGSERLNKLFQVSRQGVSPCVK